MNSRTRRPRQPPSTKPQKLLECEGAGMASSWKDVLILTRADGAFMLSAYSVGYDRGEREPYTRYKSEPFSDPAQLVGLLLEPADALLERYDTIDDTQL